MPVKRELPQADVVIESKLDPVDDLWDLRHHRQNCHPDKILRKPNANVSAVPTTKGSALGILCWPGRHWAGWVWAECSPWPGQHRRMWGQWPRRGWRETSTWTSGPRLRGFPWLHREGRRWARAVTALLAVGGCDFQEFTCLVLLQRGRHKCGSESSAWRPDQWCKQLARERTPCTPKAWRDRQRRKKKTKKLFSSFYTFIVTHFWVFLCDCFIFIVRFWSKTTTSKVHGKKTVPVLTQMIPYVH